MTEALILVSLVLAIPFPSVVTREEGAHSLFVVITKFFFYTVLFQSHLSPFFLAWMRKLAVCLAIDRADERPPATQATSFLRDVRETWKRNDSRTLRYRIIFSEGRGEGYAQTRKRVRERAVVVLSSPSGRLRLFSVFKQGQS